MRLRSGGGGRAAAAAAAAATAGEPKLPRGSRETAALLRANGYGVLNQEKLRHKHDVPAGAPQQAPPQQQQQQRHVRVMEPPVAQAARRPADKRKHAEPSSSEDERPVRSTRSGGAQQQPHALQGGGMKRVRSSWKMRPLLVGGYKPRRMAGARSRQLLWLPMLNALVMAFCRREAGCVSRGAG